MTARTPRSPALPYIAVALLLCLQGSARICAGLDLPAGVSETRHLVFLHLLSRIQQQQLHLFQVVIGPAGIPAAHYVGKLLRAGRLTDVTYYWHINPMTMG